MKSKIYFIKFLLGIFLFLYSNFALSDEFKFNASEIVAFDNGNLIKGYKGVEINDGLDFIITGDTFEFNKIKSELKVENEVLIKDWLNKNTIKSNKIIFYKKLNIIKSLNETIIELNDGHIIESSNIIFNKNLNNLTSNEKTQITDLNDNKIKMNNFSFDITRSILTAKNVKIIDNRRNIYVVKNIKYNLKTNEILGKDLSLSLNNDSQSNENEPRLKGNAFIYKNNITKINKGVFTTCKKNDECPPWVLSSEKIEHNKMKKTINYTNAWLKIYDIPVIYFPKFFHPDPTVKRQSGFLVPGFSQSSNLGNYISTPYFAAISGSSDFTFSPRFYDDGKSLYQGEFRKNTKRSEHIIDFSLKNKGALAFDEKDNSNSTHFFSKSRINLNLNNFDETNIDLKIQQTSTDDYLKTYKLKSPLMQSENDLHSKINFNAYSADLEIEVAAEVYENLGLSTSDRYEYIYPSFSVFKNIKNFDNGNLTLNSVGLNKEFGTNVHEKTFINDLNYKSFNKIGALGFISNYEVLIKNFNVEAEKSTSYKKNTENSLQSIVNYEIKYPLQKVGQQFRSTLTPIVSARYSPNESKDKSQNDRIMNLNNIFSINRIGYSDSVEGGQSITIGNEYNLYNNDDNKEKILSVNLATSIRDTEDKNLPINSTIGKKNSDVFGNIDFNVNKFIDFDYNFALDNNLKTINYNQIKSTLTFYNFVSTFDFLERNNNIGSESYISNKSIFNINESSSMSFKTRRNKETDLTEYYNLLYEYKNDCLIAGVEFNKNYYSDGSLKPEEQLFFSITIMPFGKINTPDINQ